MKFKEINLQGAYLIDLDRQEDGRGFFARAFCVNEFAEHGLASQVVQANLSYSHSRGTLRGLHYQVAPAQEPKFIRCIRGVVWDVIVDMREGSPTYLRHFGVELSANNRRGLYVPDHFAHGYQTLTDGAEVLYLVGGVYMPGFERGLRYDDPALGIEWPMVVTEISEKDRAWPLRAAPPADIRPSSLSVPEGGRSSGKPLLTHTI